MNYPLPNHFFFFKNLETALLTSSFTQELFGEAPPRLPFPWSHEVHRAHVLVAGNAEGSLDPDSADGHGWCGGTA